MGKVFQAVGYTADPRITFPDFDFRITNLDSVNFVPARNISILISYFLISILISFLAQN